MYKIVLVEHVLAHYRKDVFEGLLKLNNFIFKIIAGKDYKGIKSLEGYQYVIFNYASWKIRKHSFYFLKGSLHYLIKEKPDAIICTGIDFHQLHTIISFFLQRFIFRKKFYWWSHGTYGNQGKLGFIIRSFFYKWSDGVLTYSQKGKESLEKMGVKSNKIQVVNNSLNNEEYGYMHHNIFKILLNPVFTILYCGRITENKKLWLLLEALGILSDQYNFNFKCIIIGDGEVENLKNLADKLNISEKVEFIGSKYGAETHAYFLNSDLFVHPGGIGLSLTQALSFGLPVITSDNQCLHGPEIELLEPGYNGDYFSDNSSKDLALKIMEWSLIQSRSKNEVKRNCIQKIIEYGYLPEVMVDRITEFINREFKSG